MSGHNKWSQIKHKKGASDAKKGVAFGKIAKAISLAARDNPDPVSNMRLKAEIERARAINMPNDNIERAIKRVSDKNAVALTEIKLECIGPAGAAISISAITDNSNRTINELKQLMGKMGARMVPPGSLAWVLKTPLEIHEASQKEQLQKFLQALDDHDDVGEVHTNAAL